MDFRLDVYIINDYLNKCIIYIDVKKKISNIIGCMYLKYYVRNNCYLER